MSNQPGQGQPWQSGPPPWETARQPGQAPPQARPLPLPGQMPMQPMQPMGGPMMGQPIVTRPGIWRIALGVWLGMILFTITMIIVTIALGASLRNEFDSSFNDSFGSSSSVDQGD